MFGKADTTNMICAALSKEPKIKECKAVQPLDQCDISLIGKAKDLTYSEVVEATITFTIRTPMEKGDYFDFALGGFTANFTNMSSVKVKKTTITPLPPPGKDMTVPDYVVYDRNSTDVTDKPNSASQGCFKAAKNHDL